MADEFCHPFLLPFFSFISNARALSIYPSGAKNERTSIFINDNMEPLNYRQGGVKRIELGRKTAEDH